MVIKMSQNCSDYCNYLVPLIEMNAKFENILKVSIENIV